MKALGLGVEGLGQGWGLRVFRLPKCMLGDHLGVGFIQMRA